MDLRFDPDHPKYEYITEGKRAQEVLELLSKEKIIGVDVESSGLDPYSSVLLLIQLGTSEISYVFDARALKLGDFPLYKQILEDNKYIKILHNAKFDYQFIKYNTGASMTNIYDTLLAEGILTAGLRGKQASLKELAMQYLNIDMDKAVRKTFYNFTGRITEEQLVYSGLDTLVLFPIFELQMKRIQQENMANIAKLEFSVTRVVAEMELRGVYINTKKWKEIIDSLQIKRNELAAQFQEIIRPYYGANQTDLFGNMTDSININSQVQLMDLFNNRLGVNIPSTGDAILEKVDHPIAKVLRDYRGYEKLISAFGDSLLSKVNKKTGRLHPDFQQLGAATGRFSCQNPNLQQIPRNSEEAPFRSCFTPAPGYKLVVADYSSMEMRVLAELAGDEKLIEAVGGKDVHSFTAALMFNEEYTDDFKKKHPDLRQAAKAINFGLMYGMGASSLARQIGVTPEVGQEYLDRYFKNFPKVRNFLDGFARHAQSRGWSATPAGRKRWYRIPDKSDPDYKKKIAQIGREAKNHPIQGTNADVTKYALVFLYERMKREGVEGYVTHTVHDEIVCEVREDQAEAWGVAQVAEMVRAGELLIKKVPVKCDPFVGDVWEH